MAGRENGAQGWPRRRRKERPSRAEPCPGRGHLELCRRWHRGCCCVQGGAADGHPRPRHPRPSRACQEPCAVPPVPGQGHPLVLPGLSSGWAQEDPSGAPPGFGFPQSALGEVVTSPGGAEGLAALRTAERRCAKAPPAPGGFILPLRFSDAEEGVISPRAPLSPGSSLCGFQPRSGKPGRRILQPCPFRKPLSLG